MKKGHSRLIDVTQFGRCKRNDGLEDLVRNGNLRWEEFSYKCHFVVGHVYIIGVIHLVLDAHVTLLGISKTLVTVVFEFTMLGC